MEIQRRYGEATTFDFPLLDPSTGRFKTGITFANGDITLFQDGAESTLDISNITHLGKGIYRISLNIAAMSFARIVIVLIDQTVSPLWSDQALLISTFGNQAAQISSDPEQSLTKGDFLALKD